MPTYSSALLPTTSGLTLGSSALRWTAYLQDVDISGNLTIANANYGGSYNVKAYGATGLGLVNESVSFQAAIDAVPATGGTVFVPPGTYLLSARVNITGRAHLTVVLDKGAIININYAGIGFLVSGASSDVSIIGGQWSGLAIATNGVKILSGTTAAASPQRIRVASTEMTNFTDIPIFAVHDGISTHAYLSADIWIEDNYVHDTAVNAIRTSYVERPRIMRNRCANCDTSSSGAAIVDFGITVGAIVTGNHVTDINGVTFTNRFGGFAASNFLINDNFVMSKANATGNGIYIDTPVNGTITGNTVYGQNGFASGIFVEVPHGVTITGNNVYDTGTRGIDVTGRNDSVQRNALDDLTNLTAGTNVTLSIDSVDFKEGTGSLKAVIDPAFTTGVVFYENLSGATNYTDGGDGNARNRMDLWMKATGGTCPYGTLKVQLSSTPNLANPIITYNVPALVSGQWQRFQFLDPKWYPFMTSIQSWGVVAITDPGSTTLKFDDWRSSTTSERVTVTGNSISHSGVSALRVRCMNDVIVASNVIDEPGWNSSGGGASGILLTTTIASDVMDGVTVEGNTVRGTANLTGAAFLFGIQVLNTLGTMSTIRLINNDLNGNFGSTNAQAISSTGTIANLVNFGNAVNSTAWGGFPPESFPIINVANQGYFLGGIVYVAGSSSVAATIVSVNNQVRGMQFVLPFRCTIGQVSIEVTTTIGSSLSSVGIYSADGTTKLIDSGTFDTSTGTLKTNSITAVTLNPGVYYYAWTSNDATVQLRQCQLGNANTVLNAQSTKRLVVAGNTSSSGVLPSSMGTITAASGQNPPLGMFER